ncbi:15751_t:CDS:2, partial [Cetraspora pellucida]
EKTEIEVDKRAKDVLKQMIKNFLEKQKGFPRQINVNFDNDLIKLTKLKKQEVKEVLNTDEKVRDEIVDLYELVDGVKIEIDYNVERKPARGKIPKCIEDKLKFNESSLSKGEQKKLENYDNLIKENTESKIKEQQSAEEKEKLQNAIKQALGIGPNADLAEN